MKNLFFGLGLITILLIGYLFISSTTPDPAEKPDLSKSEYAIYGLDIPMDIDFAGEKPPLEIEDVRELLDKELLINTYWQSNALLYFKRANRWFPLIEKILKEQGVPEDFKYITLIESGLDHVVSPSRAASYWQFLKGTAQSYGLEVDDDVDERYNISLATEAACKYFKDAYNQFNNWTLAAASYNMGMGGINGQLKKQNVDNFYDLYLNRETTRYIYRLLAVKEIIENPEKYGFHFADYHLYQPYENEIIEIDTTIPDLVEFAQDHGITYRQLKVQNPWLRSNKLSNSKRKIYYIEIPKSKEGSNSLIKPKGVDVGSVDEPIESVKEKKAENEEALEEKLHIVSKKEDITMVAEKYDVKISQIVEWNNLRSEKIKQGQQLIIYITKPSGK